MSARRVPVNGWQAWVRGFTLADNPFHAEDRRKENIGWAEEYRRAEKYHWGIT